MHTDLPPAAGPPVLSIPGTGAEIIVDTLLAHGLDTISGYPGASVLPLLERFCGSPVRFVVPCHGRGGCHMADAYAQTNGKTGVIVAGSGPGACSLVFPDSRRP